MKRIMGFTPFSPARRRAPAYRSFTAGLHGRPRWRRGVRAVSAIASDMRLYRPRRTKGELVAGGEHRHGDRGREDDHALARPRMCGLRVARRRPPVQHAAVQPPRASLPLDDDAVGQPAEPRLEPSLRPPVEPIGVQDTVRGVGARVLLRPGRLPTAVVRVAALRARAVAGGEGGRLVEEEELRPAVRAADLAMAPLE